MVEAMERLLAMQELDLELKRLQEEVKALAPRVEGLQKEINRREEGLKKLEADAGVPAATRRRLEGELKMAEDRVEKAKRLQTMVRTQKELEAAQHDLDGAQARVSQLEDEILGLLEEEERLRRDLEEKRGLASRQNARTEEERSRLAGAMAEKQAMVRDLKEDRIVAGNRLDPEERTTYEYILKMHHGPPAIVGLRGGDACGGCGAVQVPQVVSQIRGGADLYQCTSCRRYLVHTL